MVRYDDLERLAASVSEDVRSANRSLLGPQETPPQEPLEEGVGRHKYNAQRAWVDGIRFDSRREARRYLVLRDRERAGLISGLELQPRFELQPGFVHRGKRERAIAYVADFRYRQDGHIVVEDVKGVQTPVFRLKRKLFLFHYPDLELRLT